MNKSDIIKFTAVVAAAVVIYWLWSRHNQQADIEKMKKQEVDANANPAAAIPSPANPAKMANNTAETVLNAPLVAASDVTLAPSINAAQNVV